ncbi:MAG TPA: hypothetical protein VF058_02735 [Actinomycetota bacterium]
MRILLLGALLVASACASSPAGGEAPVPRELTGAITEIARGDGGEIEVFTVEGTHRIRIDQGRDYGFNLEHLAEHQTTGDPVRVTTESRYGVAYAVEILDA